MSIMNLGSGTSIWLGPAIVGIFLPRFGVSGVIWIFALLYVLAALLTTTLRLPSAMVPADLARDRESAPVAPF